MKTCLFCGVKFMPKPSTAGKYCSRKCCDFGSRAHSDKRFWEYVDKRAENECWPWTRGRNRAGYGKFWREGKTLVAHRRAYELTKGPIPENHYVCHSCDNPPCCNPRHLWVGTAKDNQQDCKNKGRNGLGRKRDPSTFARGDSHWTRLYPERLQRGDNHHARKHPERLCRGKNHPFYGRRLVGEQNPRAKFKEQDIKKIRQLYASGAFQTHIAKIYGVAPAQISAIITRKTWKHI